MAQELIPLVESPGLTSSAYSITEVCGNFLALNELEFVCFKLFFASSYVQINQPRLPMRTLDPRILPRGPDFTPAFADFGRHTPGGRGVPVSACSLQQSSQLECCGRHLV